MGGMIGIDENIADEMNVMINKFIKVDFKGELQNVYRKDKEALKKINIEIEKAKYSGNDDIRALINDLEVHGDLKNYLKRRIQTEIFSSGLTLNDINYRFLSDEFTVYKEKICRELNEMVRLRNQYKGPKDQKVDQLIQNVKLKVNVCLNETQVIISKYKDNLFLKSKKQFEDFIKEKKKIKNNIKNISKYVKEEFQNYVLPNQLELQRAIDEYPKLEDAMCRFFYERYTWNGSISIEEEIKNFIPKLKVSKFKTGLMASTDSGIVPFLSTIDHNMKLIQKEINEKSKKHNDKLPKDIDNIIKKQIEKNKNDKNRIDRRTVLFMFSELYNYLWKVIWDLNELQKKIQQEKKEEEEKRNKLLKKCKFLNFIIKLVKKGDYDKAIEAIDRLKSDLNKYIIEILQANKETQNKVIEGKKVSFKDYWEF